MTEPITGKQDRTWLYVGLVFAIFWGAYLAFFGTAKGPSGGLELGDSAGSRPADYSWKLFDLDDKPVDFASFKGKTVFLNIWATWCGPCIGEMPSIAALASNPKLKEVVFICVSTDESSGTVKRFLEGKNWSMTILRANDAPSVFATEGIPATFIIAPNGRVAAAQVGSTDWNEPKVIAFLESLATEEK